MLPFVGGMAVHGGAITVASAWGSNSGNPPTSADRALSVPGGNSGQVVLTFAVATGSGTPQYRINSGTWTTFTSPTTINVSDTQTLGFRINGLGAGGEYDVTATDNDTNTQIGTWNGTRP